MSNAIGGAPEGTVLPFNKIGNVPDGSYTETENDGTVVAVGDAATWDEISQPFVGTNIFTVAGRVDYNYTELTLDFATNARYPEEPVGIVTQLIHSRRADSDIRPHIHWMQNSDANPNILVRYRWCNTMDVSTAWELKALTAADNAQVFTAVGMQQITSFNLPAGHGVGKELSATFDCMIYRDSANTSGLFAGVDTYAGLWNAKYYDIHFEKDMNGSREEFVK